jgi:hypothetical protein
MDEKMRHSRPWSAVIVRHCEARVEPVLCRVSDMDARDGRERRAAMNEKRAWMWRCASIGALALATLMGMTGCTAVRVKLGARVHIDKLPVTTIEASLLNGPAIRPGQNSPMVVTFTDATGKVWVTEGAGQGKILWSDLTVSASVVTVNKKGVLSLPHDPRKSDGKTGQVEISVPSHPELHASLTVPVSYSFPFAASFSGASGMSGTNGTDGSDGMSGSSGSMGSCVPDSTSAGGDGGTGTDGSDGGRGGDGDNGGNAPPVKVMIALQPGAQPLLQAVVSAPGRKDRHFLIDPQGGSLTITSVGGAGGSGGRGGKGGRGGSGGSGGIGCPNGSDGRSGLDGHDGMPGSDGFPGSAGVITIVYDPAVKPFLAAIKTSNKGAPAPVYQEAPVGPLW